MGGRQPASYPQRPSGALVATIVARRTHPACPIEALRGMQGAEMSAHLGTLPVTQRVSRHLALLWSCTRTCRCAFVSRKQAERDVARRVASDRDTAISRRCGDGMAVLGASSCRSYAKTHPPQEVAVCCNGPPHSCTSLHINALHT